MRYHALIPLLAAISCLGLAIFVRRAGPRTTPSSVFVFLALVLVFWNLNFFVLYFVTDYDLAFYLTSVFRVASLFLPPAILHLSVVLGTEEKARLWHYALWGSYLLAIGLTIANATGSFVIGLRVFAWGFSSVSGPA